MNLKHRYEASTTWFCARCGGLADDPMHDDTIEPAPPTVQFTPEDLAFLKSIEDCTYRAE